MAQKAKGGKRQPNILVIFGDDIGYWNISTFNQGMMGYRTPNIDRIAEEGGKFVEYYGQQSCTAGRAAFITGQNPVRTGLTKVGMPAAKLGLQKEDPTIAELLKAQGYKTAQFGKNHLGDRNEFLPTVHGFDEFFGNLYHLNAEEEPENPDYPKDPKFKEQYGPRGVLRCVATDKDDASVDPRWGRVGKQKIEDTGPLNTQRMETVDEEFLAAACDYLERAKKNGAPFFMWFNSTRMHMFTHVKPENQGKTGLGTYADGMVEHDGHVGKLLEKLDQLGLADDTIVVYTTDNGPMACMWPDAAQTPFRGEKDTGYEGAFRVPAMIRWPGVVKPGTVFTDMMAGQDWLPTFLAAAGDPDIVEKCRKGHKALDKTFKVHLDGYDQTEMLSGKGPSKRQEFLYMSDDGDLLAARMGRFKAHFEVQKAQGFSVWVEPFDELRVPQIFDLKIDPLEKGDDGIGYLDWQVRRVFFLVPVQEAVAKFYETFKEFPVRQAPSSFTISKVSLLPETSPTAKKTGLTSRQ